MKRFSHILSKIVLIFFLLVLNLAIFNTASGQGEYIIIESPTGGTVHGTITVSGKVMTQVSWIGLYLFDSSMAPALTNAICNVTTYPYYQCSWNTNQTSNGSHVIRTGTIIAGVSYYSNDVSVTVDNGGTIILPITPSPTPPQKTPTPSPSTPTPTPSLTITSQPIIGRPDLSPIPVAAPVTPPPNLGPTIQELIASSQVITAINYQIDLDKPLHLERLESRQTTNQQKFLLFTGQSYVESYLKITLNSQPLVMTAKSDSSGSWQYVLDKPLEPGNHQVFVEVNNNGQVVQSGPYPFTIARAQATSDNPLGTSLTLVDPQKQMLKNYLYLAGGVVILALLVMLTILYFRKLKKMRNTKEPIKEPSAI